MYKGFRFVGSMVSIHEQRVIERAIIERFLQGHSERKAALLDVGVGDGRELETFLESKTISRMLGQVVALDIEDWFTREVGVLPGLTEMASWLKFVLRRAEHISHFFDKESFHIVQCGFVFHEIPYGRGKERVARGCFQVLKPGGVLIYSDMFLDNQPSDNKRREVVRRRTIRRLYGQYLKEADEALEQGRLTKGQWGMLRGDGIKPGLLKSLKDALSGKDDFYEPLGRCIDRLFNTGFVQIQVHPNRLNDFLYIIVARKPA